MWPLLTAHGSRWISMTLTLPVVVDADVSDKNNGVAQLSSAKQRSF
jgi:hypothetical protein